MAFVWLRRTRGLSTDCARNSVALAVCLVAACFAKGAFAQTPYLSHFEVLDSVAVDKRPVPGTLSKLAPLVHPDARQLSLSAYGRRFSIRLRPNTRIMTPLIAGGTLPEDTELQVLTGELDGAADSWARITLRGTRVSGAIWDGATLYFISQAETIRDLVAVQPPRGTTVIYRANDLYLPGGDLVRPGTGRVSAAAMLKHMDDTVRSKLSGVPLPTRAISLGVIADPSFGSFEYPVDRLVEAVNVVDGIFTSQLDIHFRLEAFDIFDDASFPFTSTDLATLLDELAAYKDSSPAYADLGVLHLLYRNSLPGPALGAAFQSSACEREFGVSITSGLRYIVMAHELAHNVGAPHDAEAGSACEATPPGFLMEPEYNANDRFSSCSLAEMNDFLSAATCLSPVGAAELELLATVPSQPVYYGEWFTLEFLLTNIGEDSLFETAAAASGSTGLEIGSISADAPGARCSSGAADTVPVVCPLRTVSAGRSAQLEVSLVPRETGMQQLTVVGSALNDLDETNNEATVSVDVEPATKVSVSQREYPNAKPGMTVPATLTVENYGDFSTAAELTIPAPACCTIVTADPRCSQSASGAYDCDIGVLDAAAESRLDVQVTVAPDYPIDADQRISELIDVITSIELGGSEPQRTDLLLLTIWGSYLSLRTELVALDDDLEVGRTAEISAAIFNEGPDSAPGATLSFQFPDRTAVDSVTSPSGDCRIINFPPGASCGVDDLAAGEHMQATVRFRPDMPGNFPIYVGSAEFPAFFDSTPDNDFLALQRNVTFEPSPNPVPPRDSGGGGGGATSWLAPLLLLLWCRRRTAGLTAPKKKRRQSLAPLKARPAEWGYSGPFRALGEAQKAEYSASSRMK
ncbi:MAG: zinc-dependent metalloprotease family protein [Pseudomonadota bacterium]